MFGLSRGFPSKTRSTIFGLEQSSFFFLLGSVQFGWWTLPPDDQQRWFAPPHNTPSRRLQLVVASESFAFQKSSENFIRIQFSQVAICILKNRNNGAWGPRHVSLSLASWSTRWASSGCSTGTQARYSCPTATRSGPGTCGLWKGATGSKYLKQAL